MILPWRRNSLSFEMELLSVWNGIPFLRSSLGLIPTSFEIGSSAFQNDFQISVQKNWLIKLLPTLFVFGVDKPKLANPCACLAVTFSLTYFWTSQIEPVWCLLSRYGGLTTFFSHFLKIQKIIRPSLFFLQALFKVQWNQVGNFLHQVLIVLNPKLGRSILCSIFCCSYADDWWILWMPESCLVVVIVVSSMWL